ncbi:hypothetical protein D9619_002228 [Psilocybe cf. subviscida]|uniref:Uncharacterized protein n=1 Tax=Psilocybe cf. subviscida TaxID=2480587 RepID=A0A8H5BGG8_9AGAR|nr:hypothetical protein D9619_002228 [Psilocybe cf. subviscida]
MQSIKKAWKRTKAAVLKSPQIKTFTAQDLNLPHDDADSLENADINGPVIHGHDYTNAEFIEIDREYKDNVITGLRKVNVISLLILTRRTGPGGKYSGIGWMDLFAERTERDGLIWPSMDTISGLVWLRDTNEDCMFRVWFCPPGLLHIEVDDDGTWTVKDILTLPRWMLMG